MKYLLINFTCKVILTGGETVVMACILVCAAVLDMLFSGRPGKHLFPKDVPGSPNPIVVFIWLYRIQLVIFCFRIFYKKRWCRHNLSSRTQRKSKIIHSLTYLFLVCKLYMCEPLMYDSVSTGISDQTFIDLMYRCILIVPNENRHDEGKRLLINVKNIVCIFCLR